MRTLRWILIGTMITAFFSLDAGAIEAKWTRTKLMVGWSAKVKKLGKYKVKAKEFDGATLDSSSGTHGDLEIGLDEIRPFLTVGLDRKSDRKANVTVVDPEDVEQFMDTLNAYLDSRQKRLTREDAPFTIDTLKAHGNLNVNGSFSKVSYKLTLKFTGTVSEGEHAGEAVKGKLKIVFKGDRF